MKVSMFEIETGMMFLDAAIRGLEIARDWILSALPRCINCGKVMDKTVCPYCGFTQK